MRKLFIIGLMFIPLTAWGRCDGIIVDERAEPVIGAIITIAETSDAAVSDMDGRFILSTCKPGDSLLVSVDRYEDKHFCVGTQTSDIEIGLCVGYGTDEEVCGPISQEGSKCWGSNCAPGYYGTPSHDGGGCYECPYNGNAVAGATSVTGCYKLSGMTGSDASGSFEYTSDCFYTN